ncbi:MAG: hypothetical protein PHQ70_09055 [Arcobacter sp.]|uniref:GTPase n=1 Tax=Arcobacter sp. TaxID=1872629 RepID=UPI00259095FA|nr:GTPase [Arcobacter sp.]MDD3009001.1 hypothetical protein [Arcobacter sp.]
MNINSNFHKEIDFKKPENVYQYIDNKLSLINYKLQLKSEDEELQESVESVLHVLNEFKNNRFNKELDDLKKYQEWNDLTIAFYGETNAGKSTIIEALRLYFKEETKLKSQNEFKKIKKYIEEKKNEIIKVEERTKDIEYEIDCIEKNKDENKKELKINIENINTNKEKDIEILYVEYHDYEKNLQNKKIEDKEKTNISFWDRLLKFMNFSNLNKEIRKLEEDLKIKKSFLDKTIILLEQESKNKIDKLNIDFELKDNNFNEKLKLLTSEKINNEQKIRDINSDFIKFEKEIKQYEDGIIISEKSDFTKKVTKYNFVYKEKKFTLLDVPGIEGDEEEVINEISNAIKKSHIIFYIHQAEKIPESGTLEKIKKHLSSSTEVYAISNRFITDLESLDIDNIEEISNDINKEMKACLNENYIKNNIISAQMMFLALTDCLTVDSDFYLEQEFLFKNISREDLLEKLKFNDFLKFIIDEVIINEKYKIKKSNYNKLDKTLCELIDILNKASIENFEPLSTQIYNEVNEASSNLRNTMRKLKIDLELAVNKQVDIFKNSTRDYIYKQIEENISDDILKSKFEVIVEKNLEQLPKSIYTSIEKIREYNQNSIFEILKNFERRVKLLTENYSKFNFGEFDSKFTIDLKIDNGINGYGLFGSILGGGATVYWALTAGNIWNPAGWTLATLGIALSALAVIISFAKSIHKIFDSDYKKSEQKKSINDNLDKIVENIKPKIMQKINPISIDFSKMVNKIIDELEYILNQRKLINQDIKNILKELKEVSIIIKKEGEK